MFTDSDDDKGDPLEIDNEEEPTTRKFKKKLNLDEHENSVLAALKNKSKNLLYDAKAKARNADVTSELGAGLIKLT